MDYGRCVASLKRHFNKWLKGERYDAESGRPHLAHVITNAMFLMVYEIRGHGNDDRSRRAFTLPSKLEQAAAAMDAVTIPTEGRVAIIDGELYTSPKTATEAAAVATAAITPERVRPVALAPVAGTVGQTPDVLYVAPNGDVTPTLPADPLAVNEVKAPADAIPLVSPVKSDKS